MLRRSTGLIRHNILRSDTVVRITVGSSATSLLSICTFVHITQGVSAFLAIFLFGNLSIYIIVCQNSYELEYCCLAETS